MKSGEAPVEIVAALVWNVPLLRSGSPSARDFAVALPGELEAWWKPRKYGEDVLGRAAQAVASERANDLEKAAELYSTLLEQSDSWATLLGLMLRAWSGSEEGTRAIVEARAAVDEIDPPAELTARLLAKLATNAFDEGAGGMGKELLADAIDRAPEQTRLRRALAVEGLNVGVPTEWPGDGPPLDPDPLVEYPWIEYDSLAAAQATLSAAVEARSQRLWTFQWGAGKTPLDDAIAAEVQATWAGALWIRRPIRKQLGAQLLTGAARTSAQWGYGVVMWTVGSGKQPERAYALAEPALDQESVDFIVRTLGEVEISPGYSPRFLSVAAAAWDALSDDALRWVIQRVEPVDADHPIAHDAHRIWAGYAARLEDEWLADFMQQEETVRTSLLGMIGTDTVKHFSDRARRAVFETTRAAVIQRSDVTTQLLRLLAVAAPAELDDETRQAVAKKASPSAVAHLVYEGHHRLVTEKSIETARLNLVRQLVDESEEARSGKVSFGSGDVRVNLGRIVAGMHQQDLESIELLMATAVEPSLPSEHLLYARAGLTLIRRASKLSATHLQTLHDASDPPGTFPEHGNITPELLHVRRLHILARDLTSDEVISVVGACRAQDARVRQVGLITSAEAAEVEADVSSQDALAWALISGLFDPEDEVVQTAVSGVTAEFIRRYPAAGRVAIERLPRLVREASVPVRAAASALARRWQEAGVVSDDPSFHAIVAQVRHDRSWLVRNAGRP